MKQRLIRYILGLMSLLVLSATIFYVQFLDFLDSPLAITADVVIDVRPGSSMQQVANQLAAVAHLERPRLFGLWARYHGFDTGLKAGEYALRTGMSPRVALAHLMSGQSIQYPVVFIEGTSVRQALTTLWSSPKLLNTLQDKSDPEILSMLHGAVATAMPNPMTSLEGLLFPDTYFYTSGATDISILRRSAAQLQTILAEEWEQREADLPFTTPYEALILASIVEKESGLLSEREQIAGVFVRRLQSGMRLQSDPTVIYGMGEAYNGNIRRVDLDATTPYNTYRIDGLPPTPIAMTGRDALHATLHPSDDRALYFVARGDGGHHFSNTLEEHNAAVRRYLLDNRPQ
jgi:UPF0755 protein